MFEPNLESEENPENLTFYEDETKTIIITDDYENKRKRTISATNEDVENVGAAKKSRQKNEDEEEQIVPSFNEDIANNDLMPEENQVQLESKINVQLEFSSDDEDDQEKDQPEVTVNSDPFELIEQISSNNNDDDDTESEFSSSQGSSSFGSGDILFYGTSTSEIEYVEMTTTIYVPYDNDDEQPEDPEQ